MAEAQPYVVTVPPPKPIPLPEQPERPPFLTGTQKFVILFTIATLIYWHYKHDDIF